MLISKLNQFIVDHFKPIDFYKDCVFSGYGGIFAVMAFTSFETCLVFSMTIGIIVAIDSVVTVIADIMSSSTKKRRYSISRFIYDSILSQINAMVFSAVGCWAITGLIIRNIFNHYQIQLPYKIPALLLNGIYSIVESEISDVPSDILEKEEYRLGPSLSVLLILVVITTLAEKAQNANKQKNPMIKNNK